MDVKFLAWLSEITVSWPMISADFVWKIREWLQKSENNIHHMECLLVSLSFSARGFWEFYLSHMVWVLLCYNLTNHDHSPPLCISPCSGVQEKSFQISSWSDIQRGNRLLQQRCPEVLRRFGWKGWKIEQNSSEQAACGCTQFLVYGAITI